MKNKNINLVKILKNCPKGTEFWSKLHGKITFEGIIDGDFPILIIDSKGYRRAFTKDGRADSNYSDGECLIVPSREQRDWSKFTAPWYKKERFDPKTLQPFDRVLVRDSNNVTDSTLSFWKCQILSFIKEDEDYPYVCIEESYSFCIPTMMILSIL